MNDFANNYVNDDNYMNEAARASVFHNLLPLPNKILLALIFAMSFLLLAFGSYSWVNIFYGFLFLIIGLFILAAIIFNWKRGVKQAHARLRTLSISEDRVIHTTIREPECIVYADRSETEQKRLSLFAVVDHYESQNYYYLVFDGQIYVPFRKEGFTVGTSQQFREFTTKLKGKSPFRPTILGIMMLVEVIIESLAVAAMWP